MTTSKLCHGHPYLSSRKIFPYLKTYITQTRNSKNVVLVVAHPDDEILWAGGFILEHREWNFFIVCLCRGMDADRAPKFQTVLSILNAEGIMDDLDDGPEQNPVHPEGLENRILNLLPTHSIDLILSHSPFGEYTRHRRHEEIGKAMISLWYNDKIRTDQLWLFAYDDEQGTQYPEPIKKASVQYSLAPKIADTKYQIITDIYGFAPNSWEALTCPKNEAFWQFSDAPKAYKWQNNWHVP